LWGAHILSGDQKLKHVIKIAKQTHFNVTMPEWEYYYENGKFFFRKWKNYEKALFFFNTALTKKPNHADCLYHKGLCLEMLGKSEEACLNIAQALCIDPRLQINFKNLDLLINICKRLEEHGDYKTALTLCDKVIFRLPKKEEFIEQRRRLHVHLGLTKIEPTKKIQSPIFEATIPNENIIRIPYSEPVTIIKKPEIKKVLASDNHESTHAKSEFHFLCDYHPKKDPLSGGYSSKHDKPSSRILNLKTIDLNNEAATIANNKYTLSKMDIARIAFFAEQIEPLIEQYKDLVICVMPKSKKVKEPSGIRMVAKKICEKHNIDGTDVIDRPVDREPRHLDGDRDYQRELSSLRIIDKTQIEGKTVLLLDDVTTTGNSLRAGKELLLSAGASQVVMFALGKTYYEEQ